MSNEKINLIYMKKKCMNKKVGREGERKRMKKKKGGKKQSLLTFFSSFQRIFPFFLFKFGSAIGIAW